MYATKMVVCLVTVLLAALACSNVKDAPAFPDDTDTGDFLGQGEDCTGVGECGPGLACSGIDGTCQPIGEDGTTPMDGPCLADWECQWGMVCSNDGTCQWPGSPGTTGPGGDCEDDSDCTLYLQCIDGTCQGFQPPFWAGTECEDPLPIGGATKVYFEIGGNSGEFFRLPFPNDIRLDNGHIDLAGFPNPGVLIDEIGNPVDEVIDMVETDIEDGFSTTACIYFRFDRWPDGGSFQNMTDFYVVNVDPDSEGYGEKASTGFNGGTARGNYICHNWLALCPSLGRPLDRDTTYAAIITDSIGGFDLGQDDDFQSMLSSTQPSDQALADAWTKYQPLRDYLADQSIPNNSISAAAVFTTGNPTTTIPKVRAAVRAEPEPTVSGIETDTGDPSFTLYTGQVSVPFYQAGDRPFRLPADGGAIEYDAGGNPLWVEDEDVNFALTVPTGTAPVGGWPVVLFAHGTGGSEMSFVDNEVAAWMADIGVAVIGLEQVMHGDRRGVTGPEADLEINSPERLYYNFLNPRAARDNNVQAAADYFQLVRLVENFAAITGESVTFDPDNIYFFGHSQGTQGQFLFAAHELLVKMVIISGGGGYLTESFVSKKKPVDVSAAIKLVLMEVDVERYHPLLNLMQTGFDPVDPLVHAGAVFRYDWPDDTYPHRHVFMSYGIGDSYTPESTQIALAKNLWVQQWPIPGHELPESVATIEELPHYGTYYYGPDPITAVVVQYEPTGDYDAHFVMFEHPDAITQWTSFVETMVADGYPTLVAP